MMKLRALCSILAGMVLSSLIGHGVAQADPPAGKGEIADFITADPAIRTALKFELGEGGEISKDERYQDSRILKITGIDKDDMYGAWIRNVKPEPGKVCRLSVFSRTTKDYPNKGGPVLMVLLFKDPECKQRIDVKYVKLPKSPDWRLTSEIISIPPEMDNLCIGFRMSGLVPKSEALYCARFQFEQLNPLSGVPTISFEDLETAPRPGVTLGAPRATVRQTTKGAIEAHSGASYLEIEGAGQADQRDFTIGPLLVAPRMRYSLSFSGRMTPEFQQKQFIVMILQSNAAKDKLLKVDYWTPLKPAPSPGPARNAKPSPRTRRGGWSSCFGWRVCRRDRRSSWMTSLSPRNPRNPWLFRLPGTKGCRKRASSGNAQAAGDVGKHESIAAPWSNPRIGLEALAPDYLPAGFAELNAGKHTVSAAWKTVAFGDSGLPQSIKVRDLELLAGGISFQVVANGEPVQWTPGKQEFTKLGKGRVEGKTALTSRFLDLAVTTRTEYDLFTRVDVTLTPKEACAVNSFTVLCPLRQETTELCHYLDEASPKPESGLEAEQKRVFRVVGPADIVARGFCPSFWLGNTRAGLSWTWESPRNWNAQGTEQILFDRKSGQLRFNLGAQAIRAGQALGYTFAIQPTPVKDMPRDWRTWNFEARGSVQQTLHEGVNKVLGWNSTWRHGIADGLPTGMRNPEEVKAIAKKDRANGKITLPYLIPILFTYDLCATAPDGKTYYYVDEALKNLVLASAIDPGQRIRELPKGSVQVDSVADWNRIWKGQYVPSAWSNQTLVMPSAGIADQCAWWAHQLNYEYDMDGLYIDGATPPQDFRIVPGADDRGFVDSEGKIRPTCKMFAMRDLEKRLQYIVKAKNPQGLISGHISGGRPASLMSNFDVALIGENHFYWYQPPDKRDASPTGDYYYAYIYGDIDRLKVEFFWRQWGVPNLLLPELRGKDRNVFETSTRGTRTMLSYVLHFDMLIWPNWCDVAEIYKWWRIKDNYGMADTSEDQVEFVPYWENNEIKCQEKAIRVSYYRKVPLMDLYTPVGKEWHERYLVIVSNLQFETTRARLALPASLTGGRIVNVDGNQPLTVQPGAVELDLVPYDFAVLTVTK